LTAKSGVNPFLAGALSRCPNCGQGALFTGFLTVVERCAACGLDLAKADSGDGPAVFLIMIVGFIVVFSALFTEIALRPPIWVHLMLWPVLAVGLCFALLRPAKGLMLAAQVRNKSGQHQRDDDGADGAP
jgi:uncharacterized protein (DUF983 family)